MCANYLPTRLKWNYQVAQSITTTTAPSTCQDLVLSITLPHPPLLTGDVRVSSAQCANCEVQSTNHFSCSTDSSKLYKSKTEETAFQYVNLFGISEKAESCG